LSRRNNVRSFVANSRKCNVFAVSLLFVIATVPAAHAYLDPGTFSFVLQTLIAALVGALFVLKSYWISIKSWFSGKAGEVSEGNDSSTNPDETDKDKEDSSQK